VTVETAGGAGSLFGALLLRLGPLVVIRLDMDGGKTGLVREGVGGHLCCERRSTRS
jgi:hypothetical protein